MNRETLVRLIVAVAAAGLLLVAYQQGALGWVREPARVKDTLVQLGPAGFAVYLLAYGFLQPFGVPGTAFVLAAGLIWPARIAIPLSMAGTILATVVGFSFARFIARDWVAKRIPQRFHTYDQRLERHGFLTVFLLRSVLWMNPTLHALFGLSRIRFSTHLVASILAYLAPVVGIVLLGDALFAVVRTQPLIRWVQLGGALGVLATAIVLISKWRSQPQA